MHNIPIENHPITHALEEYGEIDTMGDRVSWFWAYGPMVMMYVLTILIVAIAKRTVKKIPGNVSWGQVVRKR